jgi:hypothetical protein
MQSYFINNVSRLVLAILFMSDCMRNSWPGHVTRMDEIRNVYTTLDEERERKTPLPRPRRVWEYITKTDVQ